MNSSPKAIANHSKIIKEQITKLRLHVFLISQKNRKEFNLNCNEITFLMKIALLMQVKKRLRLTFLDVVVFKIDKEFYITIKSFVIMARYLVIITKMKNVK